MKEELNHLDLYDNVLEMPRDKQIEMAEFFAEGNDNLKDLLLLAWSKGLKSTACCAGHYNDRSNMPYISFNVTKKPLK